MSTHRGAAGGIVLLAFLCLTLKAAPPSAPAGETSVFGDPPPAWLAGQVQATGMGQGLFIRLSPDGSRVLYTRPKPQAVAAPDQRGETEAELFLRELATGKETAIPLPPTRMSWKPVFTKINCFDPTGQKLVLADIDATGRGPRARTEVVLYDIASGKLTHIGLHGMDFLARFDWTGKRLVFEDHPEAPRDGNLSVATVAELKARPLAGRGEITSVCPAADVITLLIDNPGQNQGMVLYDFANDKQLAALPLHPKYSSGPEPKWTADGRYLCYSDFKDGPAGGKDNFLPIVHIYDRVAQKEVAVLDDAAGPAGPGPTPTTMVLAVNKDHRPAIALYDAATGRTEPLGDAGWYPLDACGKRLLFMKLDTPGVFVVPLLPPHKD